MTLLERTIAGLQRIHDRQVGPTSIDPAAQMPRRRVLSRLGAAITARMLHALVAYQRMRGRRFVTLTVAVVALTYAFNRELFAVVGQQLFRPMTGAVFGLVIQLIFVPYRDDVDEKPDLERYYDRRARLMGYGAVAFCIIP